MNLGQHKVTMYDDISELPIVRFQQYNKMLMIDAGLGETMEAFDAHLARVGEYIKHGEMENANREIDNVRQTLWNVQNGMTPHFMSLIPLIAEIDGEPNNDMSDDGIKATYEKLKHVTLGEYEKAAQEVKKKIEGDLEKYFHQGGVSAESKEYWELVRRKALLQCDEITEGSDHSEEIAALDSQRVRVEKPRIFQGDRNAEVLYDKNFVGCCIAIAQNLNMDAKHMTVLEYYRAIEVLEEQQKQLKKR